MRKTILYAFIGIMAAFIDFCIFYVLRRGLGLALLVANTVAVCSGIAFSFFVNRRYNFKVLDRTSGRFFRFAIVAWAGLAASNAFVYVFTMFDMPVALAKAASIFIIGGCQFLVNFIWTFSVERYADGAEAGLKEAVCRDKKDDPGFDVGEADARVPERR
jgi:putative flippase GtrA